MGVRSGRRRAPALKSVSLIMRILFTAKLKFRCRIDEIYIFCLCIKACPTRKILKNKPKGKC